MILMYENPTVLLSCEIVPFYLFLFLLPLTHIHPHVPSFPLPLTRMNRRDLLDELYSEIDYENDDYDSSSSSSSSSSSDNDSSDNEPDNDEYSGGLGRKRGDKGESDSDKSVIKRLLADLEKTGCTYEFTTRRRSFSITSSQGELRQVPPERRPPALPIDSLPPPLFIVNDGSTKLDKTVFMCYDNPPRETVQGPLSFVKKDDKLYNENVIDFVKAFFDYKNGNGTSRDDIIDIFNHNILGKKSDLDLMDDLPALVPGNNNNNTDDDDDETLYDTIEEEMTDICQKLSVSIEKYKMLAMQQRKLEGNEDEGRKEPKEEEKSQLDSKQKKRIATKPQSKASQEPPKKPRAKNKKSEEPPKTKLDSSPQAQIVPQASTLVQKALQEKDEEDEKKSVPYTIGRCCFSGCKEAGGKILSTDNYTEFRCTAKCVFMLHKKCIKLFDNNLNSGLGTTTGGSGGGPASSSGGSSGPSSNCCCNYMDCPTPSCWGKIMSAKRISWENGIQSEKLIVVIKKDQIKKLFGTKPAKCDLKAPPTENTKKPQVPKKKAEKKAILPLPRTTATSTPSNVPIKQDPQKSPAAQTAPKNNPPEKEDEGTKKESENEKTKKAQEVSETVDDKDKKGATASKTSETKIASNNNSDKGVSQTNINENDEKKKLSKKPTKKDAPPKKDIQEPPASVQADTKSDRTNAQNKTKEKNTGGLISFGKDIFSQGYWNRTDYPPWTGDSNGLFIKMGWKDANDSLLTTSSNAVTEYKSIFDYLFD